MHSCYWNIVIAVRTTILAAEEKYSPDNVKKNSGENCRKNKETPKTAFKSVVPYPGAAEP